MERIRQEVGADYKHVEDLVKESFSHAKFSTGNEHRLVKKLRETVNFIPFLSLVYEIDNKIVGYILLTKVIIENNEKTYTSLALAPLAVLSECQNNGIGEKLVNEGIRIGKDIGFCSIIVVGDNKYYERFGFVPASKYNLESPVEIPDENFMILELIENGLNGISGIVKYPKEFFEE